ncbi:HipA family kinase [Anditalea andensis]|uniref:HipA-like kinase domain-containing protein n=1 Tax=Anditalea andensis TaxID=1048983 RepID=A0A074LMX6_9BACT|nr:HipA family kinase [Anditalea andensis]KEO75247.1 hypothetical protein EL17_06215 [Anditalea andensis]
MLKIINTLTFKEELVHQNSAPMLFLCDDYEHYYCKSKLQEPDHDFLIYEMIGSKIADYFNISTPHIALVQYDEVSLGENYLLKNYNLKHGDFLFASQYIGPYDHIDNSGRFFIKNRRKYAKIDNPKDILRITLMDIHLNNADRNESNYNLLYQTQKFRYYAIDHAALFGGPALRGRFSPGGDPALGNKLLNSFLLRNILKFLSLDQIKLEVDNYFLKCNASLGTVIESVFNSIPKSWTISQGLKERILEYSLNETRLNLGKLLVMKRLTEIKKKL